MNKWKKKRIILVNSTNHYDNTEKSSLACRLCFQYFSHLRISVALNPPPDTCVYKPTAVPASKPNPTPRKRHSCLYVIRLGFVVGSNPNAFRSENIWPAIVPLTKPDIVYSIQLCSFRIIGIRFTRNLFSIIQGIQCGAWKRIENYKNSTIFLIIIEENSKLRLTQMRLKQLNIWHPIRMHLAWLLEPFDCLDQLWHPCAIYICWLMHSP